MAMQARIEILRHHGPQALRCRLCGNAFLEGMLIEGPSRNRQNLPDSLFKKEYWHANCDRPYGWNPPAQQTNVVVNSSNNDAWQREPTPTPTPDSPAPVTDTSVAPVTNTNVTHSDLVAGVVEAINKTLIPQLQSASDELESKIDGIKTDLSLRLDAIDAEISDLKRDNIDLHQRLTAIERTQSTVVHIHDSHTNTVVTYDAGRQHETFEKLLNAISCGVKNIQITGPAGSGKSEAAKAVARALNYSFYLQGVVSDPSELVGYNDVNGRYVPNGVFYGAFTGETNSDDTNGSILLLDEMDAWDPRAGLAINPALANDICAFPCGTRTRHPNNIIIACTNTWGFGGDDNYVGRNRLDGSTLDRFSTLAWNYDENFEKYLCGYGTGDPNVDAWVDAVQAVRAAAKAVPVKIAITPRMSIDGANFIRRGMTRSLVTELKIQRFRSNPMWMTIGKALEDWAIAPHKIVRRSEAATEAAS